MVKKLKNYQLPTFVNQMIKSLLPGITLPPPPLPPWKKEKGRLTVLESPRKLSGLSQCRKF